MVRKIKEKLYLLLLQKTFKLQNKYDKLKRFAGIVDDFLDYYNTFQYSNNENGIEILDSLSFKLQKIRQRIIDSSEREDKEKIVVKISNILKMIDEVQNKGYETEDWEKEMKKDLTPIFREIKNNMFEFWI